MILQARRDVVSKHAAGKRQRNNKGRKHRGDSQEHARRVRPQFHALHALYGFQQVSRNSRTHGSKLRHRQENDFLARARSRRAFVVQVALPELATPAFGFPNEETFRAEGTSRFRILDQPIQDDQEEAGEEPDLPYPPTPEDRSGDEELPEQEPEEVEAVLVLRVPVELQRLEPQELDQEEVGRRHLERSLDAQHRQVSSRGLR